MVSWLLSNSRDDFGRFLTGPGEVLVRLTNFSELSELGARAVDVDEKIRPFTANKASIPSFSGNFCSIPRAFVVGPFFVESLLFLIIPIVQNNTN